MVDKKSKMGTDDIERRRNQAQAAYSKFKENNTRIEGQKEMLDEQKQVLKRKLKQPYVSKSLNIPHAYLVALILRLIF